MEALLLAETVFTGPAPATTPVVTVQQALSGLVQVEG